MSNEPTEMPPRLQEALSIHLQLETMMREQAEGLLNLQTKLDTHSRHLKLLLRHVMQDKKEAREVIMSVKRRLQHRQGGKPLPEEGSMRKKARTGSQSPVDATMTRNPNHLDTSSSPVNISSGQLGFVNLRCCDKVDMELWSRQQCSLRDVQRVAEQGPDSPANNLVLVAAHVEEDALSPLGSVLGDFPAASIPANPMASSLSHPVSGVAANFSAAAPLLLYPTAPFFQNQMDRQMHQGWAVCRNPPTPCAPYLPPQWVGSFYAPACEQGAGPCALMTGGDLGPHPLSADDLFDCLGLPPGHCHDPPLDHVHLQSAS